MPRYFVTDPPVAIIEDVSGTDRHPNVIWIRAKMDMQTDARVKNELIRIGEDNTTVMARIGENQLALLLHNITAWGGPDLDGVPCDAEHIKQLDPTEPHIQAVLQAIAERNRRPAAPKKSPGAGQAQDQAATGNTSENGGEVDSNPRVGRGRAAPAAPRPESENGTLVSSSLGDSAGRQNR